MLETFDSMDSCRRTTRGFQKVSRVVCSTQQGRKCSSLEWLVRKGYQRAMWASLKITLDKTEPPLSATTSNVFL
jgi:hypothetical protein